MKTDTQGSILVVDDEKHQRDILTLILKDGGHEIVATGSPVDALRMLDSADFDLILTDLRMPLMDGVEFLKSARQLRADQIVVVITAHGSVATAVEAMKQGAYHYLTKPLNRDELLMVVERGVKQARLVQDNQALRSQLEGQFSLANIVGEHGLMQEVFRLVRKVAPGNTTVIIYGESGAGKELVAQAIHQLSPRAGRPIQAMNCAAIPESLLESELFGYERGAFTGAYSRKKGLLELASGSTLFLDEIGDMSLPLQGKLLRVLQERQVQRLGSNEAIRVDVRIISATSRDLRKMTSEGTFREDLYYRLTTFPVPIPPLRDRATDIPLLIDHFLHEYAGSAEVKRVSPRAMKKLMSYYWPGNVRQLESVVERAVILADSPTIEEKDLPQEVTESLSFCSPYADIDIPQQGIDLEELEKHLVFRAMEKSGGVIAQAARLLNLSYRTLQYRLEKYRLAEASSVENNDISEV